MTWLRVSFLAPLAFAATGALGGEREIAAPGLLEFRAG